MADPSQLSPDAVPTPAAEFRSATILTDAASLEDEVRCGTPSLGSQYGTDPLPWDPVVRPAGFYYPKQGDPAILAYPRDGGPPAIVHWRPAATEPDIPLP